MVELLVVISIIGVLAAMLLINFNSIRSRSRDARRKADLDQIKKAVRIYYNDMQGYPTSSGGVIQGCGATADAACNWGSAFIGRNSTTYMGYLPVGPQGSAADPEYEYVSPDTDLFVIVATLENEADEDIVNSQARCPEGVYGLTYAATDYVVCQD